MDLPCNDVPSQYALGDRGHIDVSLQVYESVNRTTGLTVGITRGPRLTL